MAGDPYEILGVTRAQTRAEVEAVLRQFMRESDPTQAVGAPFQKLAQLEELRREAKEAFAEIARERGWTEPASDSQRCEVCGGSPAQVVKFGHITGWIVWLNWVSQRRMLCRNCGLNIGRAEQSRTMASGWWGCFAFFVNLWFVVRNTLHLIRARLTPLANGAPSLPPGRPVFFRLGFAVTLLVFGLLIYGSTRYQPLEPGACLAGPRDDVGVVKCDQQHWGLVVVEAPDPSLCPPEADGWVVRERSSQVFCFVYDV